MFTEREQAYLKALSITSLRLQQESDFNDLHPEELLRNFNSYLEDYFYHFPLSDCSDD